MITLKDDGYLRPQKSHTELREDFQAFDRNRDGRIDFPEFKQFLGLLDDQSRTEELLSGFSDIDSDRDGLIDFQEFLYWWRRQ